MSNIKNCSEMLLHDDWTRAQDQLAQSRGGILRGQAAVGTTSGIIWGIGKNVSEARKKARERMMSSSSEMLIFLDLSMPSSSYISWWNNNVKHQKW